MRLVPKDLTRVADHVATLPCQAPIRRFPSRFAHREVPSDSSLSGGEGQVTLAVIAAKNGWQPPG